MYDKFMDMAVGYMKLSVGTIRSQITSLSTPTGTIDVFSANFIDLTVSSYSFSIA
jgi:hypothetical protein